ncbi:hypothetical protein GIB67_013794 [Kingdonia uniflora]|uniref:Uncharacterized protein n=1 Tax=Kingdonia uniflora TaxID=39325 RepID=A0A7J7N7H3_9MAGN|nr:hypothetical protein GIB67_013794 [Kingdonia uniflora]
MASTNPSAPTSVSSLNLPITDTSPLTLTLISLKTPQPTASFASVASVKALRPTLNEFNLETRVSFKYGVPVISFSPSDLAHAFIAVNTTLVMKFQLGRPKADAIESNINSNWGLLEKPTAVAVLDFKHMMVMMKLEKGVTKALIREFR